MAYGKLLRFALVAALSFAALVIAVPVTMRLAVDRYMYESAADVPHADAALVLGASVVHGKPSPILEERAHEAVELYRTDRVDKILVTGDNGSLSHDEVTPVRKYLIDAGIPAGDIFLDHAGFDTYSSMYRARDVFGAQSLIVVTQDFHLPRALWIARSLGIDAYGIAPAGGGQARDYVREIPASVKALLDIMMHRTPKYLGEKIPLSGDGSTTWF
jgi:SanA protein